MERRSGFWSRFHHDHLADDEVPDDVAAPVEADERHDVVEYDLQSWTGEQVHAINEQLELAHVPHEWHHGALHVPGRDEAFVDELVDTIDEMRPIEGEVVEYELPDWTPEQRNQLAERLVALEVNCRWDGYLLSIGEADEARVDAEVTAIDPSFSTEPVEGDVPPPTRSYGLGSAIADIADGFLR